MTNRFYNLNGEKLTLHILVQPKSSKSRWGDVVQGEALQLRITAPPVDGAANKACIEFIAKAFKTAKSNVSILKGKNNRRKTVCIESYDPNKLDTFLKRFASE